MTPTRKIITTVITIAAIAGCFVAFRKEGQLVVAKQSTEQNGVTLVDGAQESVPLSPITSTDYSASAMASHLELTPANIIWFTNYYRKQNKIAPLSTSTQLNHSSADKIANLFQYQYFAHTQPGSNRTFDVFFDQEGYDFIKIGENLAMGNFTTSKEVVDAWMNSPEHKRNILDPVYTNIGVSVDTGIMAGKETYIVVQHFGKPKDACPVVDQNLNISIQSLKPQISSLQKQIQSEEGETTNTNPLNSLDNSIIDQYNSLVDSYNLMTGKLTTIISTYDQQVTAYDKCIAGK